MRRPTLTDRFRYWFDAVMARGTVAQIGLLAIASFALILLGAIAVVIFGAYPVRTGEGTPGFAEVLWDSMTRAISSGSIREDIGWGYRAIMFVVTIGGLIVVAALIGIVSSSFEDRIHLLRAGRSRVLETGHTVILGWSGKVVPIVSELCEAEHGTRSAVVILSPRDKAEVEEELRVAIPDSGRTKIIVRSGQPMNRSDLAMVNPTEARSIIVLGPDGAEDPDSEVIKTVLALTSADDHGSGRLSIIAELARAGTLKAARLIAPGEVRWVLGTDLIGRITVQSCRHSGLSVVHTALLDFAGDEFYFSAAPSLVGKTFADASRAYAASTVVGIASPTGIHLNPPTATVLGSSDELIHIAKDAGSINLEPSPLPRVEHILDTRVAAAAPQRTLVLGAHAGLTGILDSLSSYFAADSTVTVIADTDLSGLPERYASFVTVERADTSERDVLERIDLGSFDHIVVLPYKDRLSKHAADARTIVTLLHLRDLRGSTGRPVPIVSEMLDDRNRELASVAEAEDFIVSSKLVSLMLAQVSQNPRLTEVFATLFSSEGSELYLRPSEHYVVSNALVSFATVAEAALLRGETAVGFRSANDQSAGSFGVVINPRKDLERVYEEGDAIIVLAAS